MSRYRCVHAFPVIVECRKSCVRRSISIRYVASRRTTQFITLSGSVRGVEHSAKITDSARQRRLSAVARVRCRQYVDWHGGPSRRLTQPDVNVAAKRRSTFSTSHDCDTVRSRRQCARSLVSALNNKYVLASEIYKKMCGSRHRGRWKL